MAAAFKNKVTFLEIIQRTVYEADYFLMQRGVNVEYFKLLCVVLFSYWMIFFFKELILINLVVIFYVKDLEMIACTVSLGALQRGLYLIQNQVLCTLVKECSFMVLNCIDGIFNCS